MVDAAGCSSRTERVPRSSASSRSRSRSRSRSSHRTTKTAHHHHHHHRQSAAERAAKRNGDTSCEDAHCHAPSNSKPKEPKRQKEEKRWKSYFDLLSPVGSYEDLKTLHKKNCKKYFCLCKRHVVSVICVNGTRKLYWFNTRSVEEKLLQGLPEGYYNKILRIVNGALQNWVQRYINGLVPSERKKRSIIMHKYNGSMKGNMKLLKEGCYCHYHPHIGADVCNADFLRRVVSRDSATGADEKDDLDALTPAWMVFILHAFWLFFFVLFSFLFFFA